MPHLVTVQSFWTPARTWVGSHKSLSLVIAIAVLTGGWYLYARTTSTAGQTRYVLGTVSSSTIISSVSGSGQVSPSDQVDIKPKVAGEITSVLVHEGEAVRAGQTLAYIDATDAQKAVRDAQANLQSANISLAKLKEPPKTLTLTQAQNALTSAQDALAKQYNDSQTDIVNTFLDLPDILTGLQNINIGTDTNTNLQWNIDFYLNATESFDIKARTYRDTAYNDYVAAKKSYDATFADYQALGQNPDQTTIKKMLNEAYTTTNLLSKALKSSNAFVQFYEDTMTSHNFKPSTVATTALTNLSTYTGKVNTHLSALLSDTTALKSDEQSIIEKQQSLDQTNAGTDTLDLQSAELTVTKAQNALLDAQNTLADYAIRAPFAGTIAKVDVKRGDQASSGTSAVTIITKDQIAELSLNEVDAAKVKVGQKATLTFDAIEDLSIAGTVASVDTLGTVTQGVVSYAVKIDFNTQDARVKPGMTVNANIIVQTAQDVLSVPSSAIKNQNGQSYVQVFRPPLPESTDNTTGVLTPRVPENVSVVTGISDDTSVQIVTGLQLGEQIVVRSVSGTASAVPSRATAGGNTRNAGFGGPGGGALRGL